MKNFLYAIIILIGGCTMTLNVKGQTSPDALLKEKRIAQELEFVLSASDRIEDPLIKVKVKAKAASVLWLQSPAEARRIFLELWGFIDKQSADSFNKEQARTVLLSYLFPKDAELAKQLLKRSAEQGASAKPVSGFDKINGNDPETRQQVFSATRLLETDPRLAASLFEQSTTQRISAIAPAFLAKLRETQPQLANNAAAQAMNNLNSQPRAVATLGMTTLAGYLFPLIPLPVTVTSDVLDSDEQLRAQFMAIGYTLLMESLAETEDSLVREQQLPRESMRYITTAQAFLAAMLATLSPRYAPARFAQLNEIANRLTSAQPKPLADLIQAQIAAIKNVIGGSYVSTSDKTISDADIINALSKGDFAAAQNLIDKLENEASKKSWTQLLLRAQSKTYVAKGDLFAALTTARKLTNVEWQMLLLADIARAAHAKQDIAFSRDVLYEARKYSADLTARGTRAKILLAIANESYYFAAPEATLMLQDAVTTLNSIASDEKNNQSGFADSNKFTDSIELTRAFAALSADDFDIATAIAGKLEYIPVQMIAKLAVIEASLKKASKKEKIKM